MQGVNRCEIWPGYFARRYKGQHCDADGLKFAVDIINSNRAGGGYRIRRCHRGLISRELDDHGKARLTTWLIEERRLGNQCPLISHTEIERARRGPRMRAMDKADRILQFIMRRQPKVGGTIEVHRPNLEPWLTPDVEDRGPDSFSLQLLAQSGCVDYEEAWHLIEYLSQQGYIHKPKGISEHESELKLTPDGHDRAVDLEEDDNPTSDRAFVAMWFDESMEGAYEDAIKPAIKSAGYKPVRVDREEFAGRIDDKIINEIRRSRFVVADFTHGEDGMRGSVYYEAGFAHGMGLDVICTERESSGESKTETVAFDLRQYNRIIWKDEEDLKARLEERITAVLGDGPHRKP